MRWLSPLLQNTRDLGRGDGCAVHGSDREVVRQPVGHTLGLVCCYPSIQPQESLPKQPNCSCGQVAQVSIGVAGMFSTDLHLS